MRRILFIDPFSPDGHINLNSNFVKRLYELPLQIDFALKKGYAEKIGASPDNVKWEIPEKYFNENVGKVKARLNLLRILLGIRERFNLNQYDWVFLSSYEEMSLYFSGLRKKLVLVNHANVAYLDSPVKRYFIKQVAADSRFVVFHEFIKQRAKQFGIRNCEVESIGLSLPYSQAGDNENFLKGIDPRLIDSDFRHIVFVPTGVKYGDSFLADLLLNKSFTDFLNKNKILLVVKEKKLTIENKNIVLVKKFLTSEQYQTLFNRSDLILLSYPSSFRYRISAILFECFSNNKMCLLSDIEGFTAFKSHFKYDAFFSNQQQLMDRIALVLEMDKDIKKDPFVDLNKLNPLLNFLSA